MYRFKVRGTLLIPLLLAVAACEEETIVPEIDETPEDIAVNDPDAALVAAIDDITNQLGLAEPGSLGEVTDGDESPAFGSQVFADAFGGSDAPELSPNVANDAQFRDIAPDRVRIFDVLALWGRLRPNPDTDWSAIQWDPALQVAEGDAVRVRREILFEANDEVHEQEERNLVTMTSWTGPHIDGVSAQVAIVAPPVTPDEITDAARPEHEQFLAFRSEPFSVKIPASELAGFRVAEIIDRTGNGVLLASMRRLPHPCAAGFMKGRWARVNERGGVFGGLWVQANGRREGYLAGRWGRNAEGERVYHGKIVNMQGQFLAFMAGTYGGGVYEGEIYGRGRVLLGHMRGRYTGEDGTGSFLGGWRQVCDKEPPPRDCRLTDTGQRICTTPAEPEPTG